MPTEPSVMVLLISQLQITRIGGPYPSTMDAPSLVLPLVYDVSTNLTQLAEKRDPGPASATTAASLQLKRFAEFGVSHNECSLFPAVRDLLCTLSLPSESQAQVRLLMCDEQKCITHICNYSENFLIRQLCPGTRVLYVGWPGLSASSTGLVIQM